MKNRKDDLHTHSIHSDGSNTPKQIVDIAIANNVANLALTDHDNIEGSKEIIIYNSPTINIYSGVELTIKYKQGRMHLLGFNFDVNDPELNRILQDIKANSIYNVLLYLEYLKKDYSIIFPQEEIDKLITSPGNIGRPQIALLLIKYNYCKTVDECFDRYLIPIYDKTRGVKKGISLEEGTSLIHNAGGTTSLAHPNSLKHSNEEFASLMPYFISAGIDSLETIHPNLTIEERKFYHEMALKHNLLESGGTDYHGIEIKPDIELATGRNNNIYIPENTLSLTKNIKNRYRS